MSDHRLQVLAALLTTALAAAWPSSTARAGYTFTNFDGPGDHANGTTINGISNNGNVVGFSTDANGVNHNFFGNPLTTPPANFTLLNLNGATAGSANGINLTNQVVGTDGNNNAFLINNGVLSNLPLVNGTTTAQVAFGINDAGTIVGQFTDSNTGTTPGFVFAGNKYTVLNPVSPTNGVLVVNAQSVNNNGLVVGFYSTATTPVIDANTPQHGFIYDINKGTFTFPKDPNQPNFFTTQILGVNDNNLAVGYWQDTAGNQHGFLYDIAKATYTFIDDPQAAPFDGKSITQITGVNNSGEITGFYIDSNGAMHGFVAVPEPTSTALIGIGLACVLGYARRRSLKTA
jgi:hypothetical protein